MLELHERRAEAVREASSADDVAARPLLEVAGLRVSVGGGRDGAGSADILRGIDFRIFPGEVVGIVGESGAGKTLTALAILGLLPEGLEVGGGSIRFDGIDLLAADRTTLRWLRGGAIGLVFQEPLTALDPVRRVGVQIAEVTRVHRRLSRRMAEQEALRLLGLVIPGDTRRVYSSHAHQLSGGQRQRVMLAVALAGGPRLLIADEPTSAIDAALRAQTLRLVADLSEALGLAVMWITHDLSVVGALCDRVVVLYAGAVVEEGSVADVLATPKHPYTQALLAAVPSLGPRSEAAHVSGSEAMSTRSTVSSTPVATTSSPLAGELLRARGLSRDFRAPAGRTAAGPLKAVDGVDFDLGRGEILGIVGGSGSGKTTLCRLVLRLVPATAGDLWLEGDDLLKLGGAALRRRRRDFQMVFQDPVGSLDPTMTVGEIVAEPLIIHRSLRGESQVAEVERLLGLVGMGGTFQSYPDELSGGQRQRVSIARALAPEPRLLVADEPTSALDVLSQAQIVELMRRLREQLGLSILFISHDLAVVSELCDRVAVMLDGRLVEILPATQLHAPLHPYARSMVAATRLERKRHGAARLTTSIRCAEVSGGPGSVGPSATIDVLLQESARGVSRVGCTYAEHCALARESCHSERPLLERVAADRQVACPFWADGA